MESVAGEEISLSRLENLGESRALEGYLGPLRSLVSYANQYSEAIAALGRDWLNAVIVEDMSALIRITETSKKLKISRLTAIPLKEVADLEQSKVEPFEGMVTTVSDAISCDPRLRGLVNFVFGDSVIVESAKYAYIAARRGFRAVTLQGDVFEPDILAFETGYSRKYAKISSLLGQQETFEGIRSALSALKVAIDKRKVSISKLHSKSDVIGKSEFEQDLNISKIESKLETTKQFLSQYSENASAQTARIKETEKDIERVKKRISSTEKRVRALSLGSQKVSEILSRFDIDSFNARSSEIAERDPKLTRRSNRSFLKSEISQLKSQGQKASSKTARSQCLRD